MRALFTVRSGEEVSALSFFVAADDSATRSVVLWRPAVVGLVDRVVGTGGLPCDVDRRDHAVPDPWAASAALRTAHAVRSTPSAAPGWQATLRLGRLSASGVVDESNGHRRHPVVDPTRNLTMDAATRSVPCQRGAEPFDRDRESPRTRLRRVLEYLPSRRCAPSIEEHDLAQTVDAQDLQVRLFALERARP